jgi:small-conductance mechanosensitive channel/CRP-like cAMP-binding protein
MGVLTRLAQIEPFWSGITGTLLFIVVLLVLRAVVRKPRRFGGGTLGVLLVALVFRVLVIVARELDMAGAVGLLGTLHLVALVLGVSGLATLVVFELGLSRYGVRVPSIMRNLVQVVVATLVLVWMWRDATNDLFSLVTTSAVLAALGFALQGTIANLFAGLSLQLEPAFQIGEWIEVGDVTGRILEVRWRNVLLATRDGDVVIVPNADLVSHRVTHLGGSDDFHRVGLTIGFHYRHPPNVVRRMLVGAARGAPGVLATPEPDCLVWDVADSAVTYRLRVWITDIEHEHAITSEIRARIWYAARRAGLEIPFPIRTLVHAEVDTASAEAEHARRAAVLGRAELFAQLDEEARALLASGMREEHFAAGEPVLRQGDAGDACYLVASGTVSVRLGVDGLEHEMTRLGPGELFGEMSLVTGEPRTASVIALTDVACHVVDRAAFRHLLDARPDVADRLSAVLAARQTELEDEREGLTAAARARREAETRSRLLHRIRAAFHMN